MSERLSGQLRWNATPAMAALALVYLLSACGEVSRNDSPELVADPVTQPDPISSPSPGSPVTEQQTLQVIARTGPILGVHVGELASLDGSKSVTTSTEPLIFDWKFSSRPEGSASVLQGTRTESPSFVADARGTYVIELQVSAEAKTSERAIALVIATPPTESNTFHQGLSTDCANCHNEDFPDIPDKFSSHLATSNACQSCHTPLGFDVITHMDHREVFGTCSECHDGRHAMGKSEFHIPTSQECGDCHDTNHFLALAPDGSFDHSDILRSCSGCHNGTISTGKTTSPPHPLTDSECGECHTTMTFEGAFPDHSGPDVVGNRCDSCHGVSAAGTIPGHPITTVDCGTCHSTATFSLGGVFNHRVVDATTQSCESCHNPINGIGAPAKTPSHPLTNDDCAVCHNTDSFSIGVFDHAGIIDNCASCHGATATGKHLNHMPTSEDCSICHTPGTFTTGTYDHFGVVNGCESCHDNVISLGKLASHLPTTEDCAACHNTADFRAATFQHVGIDTGDCASCHDGTISLGKSANHVPTELDCSACHDVGDFTTFAGITFSHAGVDPENCGACHDTGIATPKAADHIPTQDDCSACHQYTDAFAFSSFRVAVHPDITSGCEGCHSPAFFPPDSGMVKAANHLPIEQDCAFCHTNTTFFPSIFNHSGISGDCSSCHDGSAGFIALGAMGEPPTPIHENTSGDCAVCHNTTSFADAYVDHASSAVQGSRCDSCHNGFDATGKDAAFNHPLTTQDCGVCHVPGGAFSPATFNHDGITGNCASCHNGTDATGTEAKIDPPHIPISEDCSACHTPTSFANAHFDHTGIVDNCSDCHNGRTAIGKSDSHVPTNVDCVNCHLTTGFLPATFDHAGITENCTSCHDAGFATGKIVNHVATTEDCGVCHTTSGFVPATFDHTGITSDCAACHGVTASGMSSDHIPTTLDCSSCHATSGFVGAIMNHQGIVGGCSTCHDGSTATGSQPQGLNAHFITDAECNACHATGAWAPIDFAHPPGSDYPGDHNGTVGCRSCHDDNDETIAYRFAQYAPDCAACHANDFDRESDHIGGENGTVEQNRDCSGGGRGCHRVSDRNFD